MNKYKITSKILLTAIALSATFLVVVPANAKAAFELKNASNSALRNFRSPHPDSSGSGERNLHGLRDASASGHPRATQRCDDALGRINEHLSTSSGLIAAKEKFVADQTALWAAQILRIKARGGDTTKYEADAKQAAILLDKWLVDVKAYWTELKDAPAVLIEEFGRIVGIVTRHDVLEFL